MKISVVEKALKEFVSTNYVTLNHERVCKKTQFQSLINNFFWTLQMMLKHKSIQIKSFMKADERGTQRKRIISEGSFDE